MKAVIAILAGSRNRRRAIWRSSAVAALVLLGTGCQLMDMMRFSYDNAKSTHTWTTASRTTTVPFILVDNHIILPVQINGSEPMNFVLDSGAGATVIIDSESTRALRLQSSGEITVSGVGTGADPVAHIIRGTTLALGTVELEKQSVIFLPLDSIPFFADLDDVYFDGVVGAPFFQRFQVAIDYDRRLLTFSEPLAAGESEEQAGAWQAIPLQIEGGVPYLAAKVTNEEGTAVEVKLLADTGARGTVSLTPATHAGLHAPTVYFPQVDQGLSGDVISRVAMSDLFSLGPYELGELPVDYAVAGGESDSDSNGIVGNEVLGRFNLVFDYANERLLIHPNQRFAVPMSADRSGLQLRPHRQGGMVRKVAPDSGAAGSGLQAGDVITSFDGSPVSTQTVGELKRALASDAESIKLCWKSADQDRCESVPLASRFRVHENDQVSVIQ